MTDDQTYESQLEGIAATLGELDAGDLHLLDPPDDLWDRIAGEIALDQPTAAPAPAHATVTSLDSRRRTVAQRTMLLVAAAAVVVVAGVAAIALRDGSDETVIAVADLGYDPDAFDSLGADASARVRLVRADDGFAVAFADADLPASIGEPADLELWLIEPDAAGGVADLVSLGVIDSTGATFVVPAGFDPDRYSVVDISVEPRDGDEQHSGRSILRGALDPIDSA